MIEVLYIIKNPCNIIWMTRNPVYAEEARQHGCIVTTKVFNGNHKKYNGLKKTKINGEK